MVQQQHPTTQQRNKQQTCKIIAVRLAFATPEILSSSLPTLSTYQQQQHSFNNTTYNNYRGNTAHTTANNNNNKDIQLTNKQRAVPCKIYCLKRKNICVVFITGAYMAKVSVRVQIVDGRFKTSITSPS